MPSDTDDATPDPYLVDIGFSSLGNPGPSAWVARITRPDGTSETIREVRPSATNAAISARAFLGVLKALPPGASGQVRSRDKEGVQTITTRLEVWTSNGWRTSSKKPVANRDTWMMVAGAMTTFPSLSFVWSDGTDTMAAIMETEARRLAEAEKIRATDY